MEICINDVYVSSCFHLIMIYRCHVMSYVYGSGYYKQSIRQGPVQNGKDADGFLNLGEAKPLKRGNISGHGSQEVYFALNVILHQALQSEMKNFRCRFFLFFCITVLNIHVNCQGCSILPYL